MSTRVVIVAILLLLVFELTSGLGSFLIGEPDGRWMFWLHRYTNGLKSLELVESGLGVGFTGSGAGPAIDITPTLSALDLYVRYQGSLLDPKDFFNVTADDKQANEVVVLE